MEFAGLETRSCPHTKLGVELAQSREKWPILVGRGLRLGPVLGRGLRLRPVLVVRAWFVSRRFVRLTNSTYLRIASEFGNLHDFVCIFCQLLDVGFS